MGTFDPSACARLDTRSASHADPAEVVAALNDNSMPKEYCIKLAGRLGSSLAVAGAPIKRA